MLPTAAQKTTVNRISFGPEDADRIIAGWEIPECDCPPTWIGEYADEYGNSQQIILGPNRKEARKEYESLMKKLGIGKGDNRRGGVVPYYPICDHVQSADNGMTLDEWIKQLRKLKPHEYCDPLFLGCPSATWPGTRARAEEYRQRVEDGTDLWDFQDLSEKHPFVYDSDGRVILIDARLGPGVTRHPNGQHSTHGTFFMGEGNDNDSD